MFKDTLKKFLLNDKRILLDKRFKIFGQRFYNPCIWYFNKYTISRAASVGLFVAWIPVPFQMFIAAAFAIVFRANISISIALVWLTNPITMPVFFLFAYKVGMCFFLDSSSYNFDFQLSFAWLFNKMCDIWQPFLLGCIICALSSSIFGNICVRVLWRFFVIKNWNKRKKIKHKK